MAVVKKVKATALTVEPAWNNALHTVTRAVVERATALLRVTFVALGHISITLRRIGAMTAAAFLVLHTENHHTA